jgi:hypothetical protein
MTAIGENQLHNTVSTVSRVSDPFRRVLPAGTYPDVSTRFQVSFVVATRP